MIIDEFSTLSVYEKQIPFLETVLSWLKKNDLNSLTEGRYDLDNRCYCVIKEGESKIPEQCKFEAHREYIDIQVLLQGKEIMSWAPISGCELITEFDQNKDIGFYRLISQPVRFEVESGRFAVFFPWDVHQPGECIDKPIKTKKAIIKIPVSM